MARRKRARRDAESHLHRRPPSGGRRSHRSNKPQHPTSPLMSPHRKRSPLNPPEAWRPTDEVLLRDRCRVIDVASCSEGEAVSDCS